MAPWLWVLENHLVQALLRTPAFHRAVERVAKGVHRIKHGIPPEEMGGTKIDGQNSEGFLRHFTEEITKQLGRAETKTGDAAVKSTVESTASERAGKSAEWSKETEETADAVWQSTQRRATEPPQKGFLGEYAGALREQLKNGK